MSIQVALNHVWMAAPLLRVGLWAAQDLRDKEGHRVWVVTGHLREQRRKDGVLTHALVEPRHEQSRTGIPPINSNKVGSLGSVMEGYHSDRWLLRNGSRLSCGRPARRRKGSGRTSRARQGTTQRLPLERERPPASSAC